MDLQAFELCVLKPGNKNDVTHGKVFKTKDSEITIGQHMNRDIRIKVPDAEDLMCKISADRVQKGRVKITNYSNRNPVKLNGVVVQEKCYLKHNDLIEVVGKQFLWRNINKRSTNESIATPESCKTKISPISVPHNSKQRINQFFTAASKLKKRFTFASTSNPMHVKNSDEIVLESSNPIEYSEEKFKLEAEAQENCNTSLKNLKDETTEVLKINKENKTPLQKLNISGTLYVNCTPRAVIDTGRKKKVHLTPKEPNVTPKSILSESNADIYTPKPNSSMHLIDLTKNTSTAKANKTFNQISTPFTRDRNTPVSKTALFKSALKNSAKKNSPHVKKKLSLAFGEVLDDSKCTKVETPKNKTLLGHDQTPNNVEDNINVDSIEDAFDKLVGKPVIKNVYKKITPTLDANSSISSEKVESQSSTKIVEWIDSVMAASENVEILPNEKNQVLSNRFSNISNDSIQTVNRSLTFGSNTFAVSPISKINVTVEGTTNSENILCLNEEQEGNRKTEVTLRSTRKRIGRALVSLNTSDFLENYEQSDESIVLDSVTAIKSIDVNSSLPNQYVELESVDEMDTKINHSEMVSNKNDSSLKELEFSNMSYEPTDKNRKSLFSTPSVSNKTKTTIPYYTVASKRDLPRRNVDRQFMLQQNLAMKLELNDKHTSNENSQRKKMNLQTGNQDTGDTNQITTGSDIICETVKHECQTIDIQNNYADEIIKNASNNSTYETFDTMNSLQLSEIDPFYPENTYKSFENNKTTGADTQETETKKISNQKSCLTTPTLSPVNKSGSSTLIYDQPDQNNHTLTTNEKITNFVNESMNQVDNPSTKFDNLHESELEKHELSNMINKSELEILCMQSEHVQPQKDFRTPNPSRRKLLQTTNTVSSSHDFKNKLISPTFEKEIKKAHEIGLELKNVNTSSKISHSRLLTPQPNKNAPCVLQKHSTDHKKEVLRSDVETEMNAGKNTCQALVLLTEDIENIKKHEDVKECKDLIESDYEIHQIFTENFPKGSKRKLYTPNNDTPNSCDSSLKETEVREAYLKEVKEEVKSKLKSNRSSKRKNILTKQTNEQPLYSDVESPIKMEKKNQRGRIPTNAKNFDITNNQESEDKETAHSTNLTVKRYTRRNQNAEKKNNRVDLMEKETLRSRTRGRSKKPIDSVYNVHENLNELKLEQNQTQSLDERNKSVQQTTQTSNELQDVEKESLEASTDRKKIKTRSRKAVDSKVDKKNIDISTDEKLNVAAPKKRGRKPKQITDNLIDIGSEETSHQSIEKGTGAMKKIAPKTRGRKPKITVEHDNIEEREKNSAIESENIPSQSRSRKPTVKKTQKLEIFDDTVKENNVKNAKSTSRKIVQIAISSENAPSNDQTFSNTPIQQEESPKTPVHDNKANHSMVQFETGKLTRGAKKRQAQEKEQENFTTKRTRNAVSKEKGKKSDESVSKADKQKMIDEDVLENVATNGIQISLRSGKRLKMK